MNSSKNLSMEYDSNLPTTEPELIAEFQPKDGLKKLSNFSFESNATKRSFGDSIDGGLKFEFFFSNNRTPRDDQFRDKESKLALRSVIKLRNELYHLQSSIIAQENLYKNTLLSNKFVGNLFGSFKPFILGINKYTVRPKGKKFLETRTDGNSELVQNRCNYIRYSMQWYLWAKRRSAELFSTNNSNSMNTGNINNQNLCNGYQASLQKEIQSIEQSVKFKLALQSDKPLFVLNDM